MEGEMQELKASVARTPGEMLARQVELLEAIHRSLEQQQRVLVHLGEQQNAQAEQVRELAAGLLPDDERNPGRQWVKVQDVNVPFINLSMFLVKVALAGIPAGIVLWVIAFTFLALVGLMGLSFSILGF